MIGMDIGRIVSGKSGIRVLLLIIVLTLSCACQEPSPFVDRGGASTTVEERAIITPRLADRLVPRLSEIHALPADELATFVSITMTAKTIDVVSAQNPGVLEIELAGREIAHVTRTVYLNLDDGRRQQVGQLRLRSGKHGNGLQEWPDGVYDLIHLWDAKAGYLTDGLIGEYTCLRILDDGDDIADSEYRVAGLFRPSGASSYIKADLIIDIDHGKTSSLKSGDNQDIADPRPGDEFRLLRCLVSDDGQISDEPGASLFFDNTGGLVYEERPLTSGKYTVSIEGTTRANQNSSSSVVFTVNDGGLIPGFRAYIDLLLGYQFLYPANWPDPSVSENRVAFGYNNDGVKLTVTTHPDAIGRSVEQLQHYALNVFGSVQVLYEDRIEVASSIGIRTVYSYESKDGPRIGAFITFVSEGAGYIADIDGPIADEDTMMEIIRIVGDSWSSRSMSPQAQTGAWNSINIDGLTLALPSDYRQQDSIQGLYRFLSAEKRALLAIRTTFPEHVTMSSTLQSEMVNLSRDKPDFLVSEVWPYELSGKEWLREDFTYRGFDGITRYGFLMMTTIADRPVALLAEASSDDFDRLANSEFMLVAADIEPE